MPQKFEKKQNSISIKMDVALFNIGGGGGGTGGVGAGGRRPF